MSPTHRGGSDSPLSDCSRPRHGWGARSSAPLLVGAGDLDLHGPDTADYACTLGLACNLTVAPGARSRGGEETTEWKAPEDLDHWVSQWVRLFPLGDDGVPGLRPPGHRGFAFRGASAASDEKCEARAFEERAQRATRMRVR